MGALSIATWLFKLLTNKYVLIGVAVFSAWLYIGHINRDRDNLLKAVQADTTAIKSLTHASNLLHGDIQSVNGLLNDRQKIYITQDTLNKKLAKIPDTTTDYPFKDPNLFEAAKELRATQNATQ